MYAYIRTRDRNEYPIFWDLKRRLVARYLEKQNRPFNINRTRIDTIYKVIFEYDSSKWTEYNVIYVYIRIKRISIIKVKLRASGKGRNVLVAVLYIYIYILRIHGRIIPADPARRPPPKTIIRRKRPEQVPWSRGDGRSADLSCARVCV